MTAAARRADPRLGVAASLVAVALVTGVIALLKGFVPVLSLGALYVFAVLPIAIAWGLLFAVGVSVASMLVFNFLFLPPVHSFTLNDSRNWFALAVYVVTSAVVSELAASSRRRATESALLAEIARSLLERRSVSDELDRIAAGAASALGASEARIELGDASAELRDDAGATPLIAGARRVGTIALHRSRWRVPRVRARRCCRRWRRCWPSRSTRSGLRARCWRPRPCGAPMRSRPRCCGR